MNNEENAVSALTGLSLDHLLEDLSLPGGSGLSNRLGISGIPALNSKQIFNERWDDEDVVGRGQGEDWEDQIDQEMQDEADVFGDDDDEGVRHAPHQEKQKRVRVIKRLVERPKSVYERFPAFEKNKVLDFTELFKGYTGQKSRLAKRPFHVETVYSRKRDVPRGFLASIVGDKRQVERQEAVTSNSIEADLLQAIEERDKTDVPISDSTTLHDRAFDLVLLSNWEDQIIYDSTNVFSAKKPTETPSNFVTAPVNAVLESGLWTQSIIWGSRKPFRDFTQLEFNHEDDIVPEERADPTRPRKRFRADAGVRDKFNLSNDHFYEVAKDKQHRVRQTFGQLGVEHAYPAQKLQLPFYKTRLSKQEARSFHRPALQFHANIEIHFSKVRTAKKKKDRTGKNIGRGGNVQEGLRRTGDLSLRDTSNFVLWEYSEEHPPIIPNFGMGSSLVNYYRKKNDKDDHVPKLDLGVPFVLDPSDDSPFKKFGYVYPGQTIPALYNNLVRAPLFRHAPNPTDFLVVKSTTAASSNPASGKHSSGDVTKYYLREIKNTFVIGQTFPITEVPGPHSRKITNTIKYRLQTIVCKLLKKSPEERLKISRLMKYFPDQNELQMRQRLKEFMEYHRRGPHQGFWRLRENWTVPSDADMLKLVTPEQVVLAESMQVGQRHLQDAGYNADDPSGANAGDGEDKDSSHLSIEQQLAPWITTKNFLYATQAKAMLRLHGEGDPTGRGEAFSFIRISMKDIFVKAGEDYEAKLQEAESRPKSAHRYNVAEQQQIYKSEIERIWRAQYQSLARKDRPQLSDDEEEHAKGKGKERERQPTLPPPPPIIASAPMSNSILPGTTPEVASFLNRTGYPQVNFGNSSPALPISNLASSSLLPGTSYFPSMAPATPMPTFTSRTSSPIRESSMAPSARGDSVARDGSVAPDARNKVLRIERNVDGEWKTEFIRDPAVIKAYVRARQLLEEDSTLADSLVPTGDAEKDARNLKRLQEDIARRKKNQERRLHRKNAKIVKEGGTPMQLNRPIKPDTTRRCGHCGQMGHMKTNRKCPRWAEFNSANGATPMPVVGPSGLGTNVITADSVVGFGPATPTATPPALVPPPVVAAASDPPKIKLTLKRS
ncbi:TAF1 transcription initiation factor TFIID subunit TAF1 [Mycena floridula]|nr:TAF1 transcription initiation factor TFIID subunit TAF1 [Mycena floridula]